MDPSGSVSTSMKGVELSIAIVAPEKRAADVTFAEQAAVRTEIDFAWKLLVAVFPALVDQVNKDWCGLWTSLLSF